MNEQPNVPYFLQGYRDLTSEELQAQIEAIKWLRKKGISYVRIKHLSKRNLNQDDKIVSFYYNIFDTITVARHFSYAGSPLERQVELAFGDERSGYFVFPKKAWNKRRRTFLITYRTYELEELANRHKKKPRVQFKRDLKRDKKSFILDVRI